MTSPRRGGASTSSWAWPARARPCSLAQFATRMSAPASTCWVRRPPGRRRARWPERQGSTRRGRSPRCCGGWTIGTWLSAIDRSVLILDEAGMTPDRDMLRRWPAGPLRPRGHWSRAAGTRLRPHRAPFPGRHHRRLPPLRGWRRAGAGLCRHEPGPGSVLRLRGGRRRGAGQRRPGPRLDSRGPPALGARPRPAGQDARTRAADRAHRRRPPSPAAGGRAGRRSLSRPRRLQPRDRPPRGALRAHRPRPPRAAVGPGSLRHHRRGRAARAL
jgi:hypothetical protein